MPEPIIKKAQLKATPEQVYLAYTDVGELQKWFASKATIEVRPGGPWRFEWPGGMAAEGKVLDAVPNERFVWTWEKSIGPDESGAISSMDSMVTNVYTFEADGDGTLLRIEETGHDSQEGRDMSEPGIDGMIATLRAYLEDGTVIDWDSVEMPPAEHP